MKANREILMCISGKNKLDKFLTLTYFPFRRFRALTIIYLDVMRKRIFMKARTQSPGKP